MELLISFFVGVWLYNLLKAAFQRSSALRARDEALLEEIARAFDERRATVQRNILMTAHHDVLGVPLTATEDEIKLAYRRLARQHHPDKGGDATKFDQIRQAYEHLMKPTKCPECQGTGSIKQKNGAAFIRVPCPRCWPQKGV